jgi:hypothetical protein
MATAAQPAPVDPAHELQEGSMRNEQPTPLETRKLQPATRAYMIFDSSLSLLPHGVRGMNQDRHLLFAAPDLSIHVRITEADRHKEIHGQVIPHAPTEESTIVMLVKEEPREIRRPDQFGEFTFNEVPAGDIVIEIILPSRRVIAAFDA